MPAHRKALTITPEEGTVLTIRMGTLGREPALALIGVLGPLAALIVSLIPGMSPGWQTTIESAVYAGAGVATAAVVTSDKLAPAVLGLGQALLNVALAAGVPLTDQQQTAIMTGVALLVAAFVRTQVTAPLPPLRPVPFIPADIPPPRPDPEPHSTLPEQPYAP